MIRTGLDALNELQGDWSRVKRIIPYGFGEEFKKHIHCLFQDFEIPYIVDSNSQKWGQTFQGVKVCSPDNLKEMKQDDRIVVCVAERARGFYREIKGYLLSLGMKENVEFTRLKQFELEWYYRYRGKYFLYSVDMALTTACTLKCKNCNMFVRYYKQPVMISYESAKRSIDLLMERIDYLAEFDFLGGEPFLHPDLGKLFVYLHERYGNRIGKLTLTTNAVEIPSRETISLLKRLDVNWAISDYTDAIGKRSQVGKLTKILEREGMSYGVFSTRIWCKTGFPEHPWDVSESEAKQHMLGCNGWRGLNDGKYYFCNIAWSAERAGLFQLQEGDYIDLEKLPPNDDASKRALLEFSLGKLPNGYMSFCKVCGGCGEDNQDFVLAGEQE